MRYWGWFVEKYGFGVFSNLEFGIFDFGQSGEVRRIAVRSVISLIGGRFFGFVENSISASPTLN